MSPKPAGPKKLSGLKRAPAKAAAKPKSSLLGSLSGSLGHATGWPALDHTEIAFRGGELTLLVGRSAHGKSNFLLNLLLQWLAAEKGKRFFFYSLEMTPQQSAARLLTVLLARRGVQIAASQALRYLRGDGAPQPVPAALAELRALEERIGFVYEPLWDIDRLAADVMARGGSDIGAIFIDPLTGLSAAPERGRPDRRDLELSHISRRLKEIAVRLSCPVIAAAPTRAMKPAEGETLRSLISNGRELQDLEVEDAIRSRRPRLSHLSEPTLEQEADLVLGLLSYLSDFQSEMEPDHRLLFQNRTRGLLELSALKNRLGPLEHCELEMDAKTSLIRDNPEAKSI